MASQIYHFLIKFADVLVTMSSNLWNLLNYEISGVPVWALLSSGVLIITVLVGILRSLVGG